MSPTSLDRFARPEKLNYRVHCDNGEVAMDRVLTSKDIEDCRAGFVEMVKGFRPLMPHRPDAEWEEMRWRLNALCDLALKGLEK